MEILKTSHTNLHEVFFEAWEIEAEQPQRFTHVLTADKRLFKWNGYLAHQFIGEGTITEETFCLMCEIPKERIHFMLQHKN